MLDFKYPTLEDRKWIQPILSNAGYMGSENAFGTLFIWSETYHSRVCRYDDSILLCSGEDSHTYNFPLGKDNLADVFSAMIENSREKNMKFRMWGMTQTEIALMEQAMPNTFEYELDRNGSDYIYNTEELIQLAGRKFHGKRNHLTKFKRTYSYTYEDITLQNLPDCIQVAKDWCIANGGCNSENGLDKEGCALRKAFENYEQLNLLGGLIRIEGKPVAFTIGEEINPKIFLLHFEKALAGYDGLYAAINQEFVAHHLAEYQYVNREEDMGLEGLRKAKLSYNPAFLLQKYSAVLK
jgi:hypothetical protein